MNPVELNGRQYRSPTRPVVVICADGCDPAYIEAGLAGGVLPTIAKMRDPGFYALPDALMPTFTNPHNISIVTRSSPAVYGASEEFSPDTASAAPTISPE